MSQSKEFQGRSLDEAIQEACDFYGLPREKLEIEIVSDAKSGIFGLVGAKRACIRAAKVRLPDAVTSLSGHAPEQRRNEPAAHPHGGDDTGSGKTTVGRAGGNAGRPRNMPEDKPGKPENRTEGRQARRPGRSSAGRDGAASPEVQKDAVPALADAPPAPGRIESAGRSSLRERGAGPGGREPDKDAPVPSVDFGAEESREDLPEFSLEDCDRETLFALVRDVVLTLVAPIVGPVPCSVELAGKRVRAALDCGEAAGLLVGRDGQTLAAVQYLAARIVSRKIGGAVRLQIDAGKYRERQDDKLRELALSLAAKVRESGRPQSTRPLSAYQRRIVHLALEQEPDVTTRSKGEGPQRRVVVCPDAGEASEDRGERREQAADPGGTCDETA